MTHNPIHNYITSIVLKHFRSFASFTAPIDHRLVLIEGPNGSGKTSLLEAIQYTSGLRSFRTHLPREMIAHQQEGFFIQIGAVVADTTADVSNALTLPHEIQIGVAAGKRSVKIDQRPITSVQQLYTILRTIPLTEHDLSIVQGYPEHRRIVLDTHLSMIDPSYAQLIRFWRICVLTCSNCWVRISNVAC